MPVLAESYFQLLTNVPHIMFELTMEVITGMIVYPAGKWMWRKGLEKHDKEMHGGRNTGHGH